MAGLLSLEILGPPVLDGKPHGFVKTLVFLCVACLVLEDMLRGLSAQCLLEQHGRGLRGGTATGGVAPVLAHLRACRMGPQPACHLLCTHTLCLLGLLSWTVMRLSSVLNGLQLCMQVGIRLLRGFRKCWPPPISLSG